MPLTRAPWHHWPVAVFALLFYLVGTLDFAFTRLHLGFYVDSFRPEQLRFFDAFPFWLNIVWAVGTIGGLFAAWLMLRRNRFSVLLLFAAFVALTFLTVWLTIVVRPSLLDTTGFLGLYTMVSTSGLALLIYIYARWERTEKMLS